MSSQCRNFRSHHLRPDKCRSCFGDRSTHASEASTGEPQQEATSDNKSSFSKSAVDHNKPNDEEKKAKIINSSNNNKKPKSLEGRENNEDTPLRSARELAEELERCRQERNKLNETIGQLDEKCRQAESYKTELDKLRLELAKSECDGRRCAAGAEVRRLEGRCATVEAERDQARDELRALEREMEELHDNFKEEESEQFEQLKQELDLAMKNCKILQIRLNKSERQYGQLEQVKTMLERQLEESSGARRQQMEQQASQSVNSNTFVQLGPDSVKLSTAEYDQLLRDLNDTTERERDLQEQAKYSQEEAQLKSDRLQAVEAENEVLLSKVNKLTLANSRLRSSPLRANDPGSTGGGGGSGGQQGSSFSDESHIQGRAESADRGEARDLIEQAEQLKLALDLAQSESQRLRASWQESMSLLEAKEAALKEAEARRSRLESELARWRSHSSGRVEAGEQVAGWELECRQLRTRLVHSERECKQLRAQLELAGSARQRAGQQQLSSSRSFDSQQGSSNAGELARYKEGSKQLREQCDSLQALNLELERRIEQLTVNKNVVGHTSMESDLVERLKRQLDVSENDLAKARSRLVELDVECGRAQRQYRRLVESLEASGGQQEQAGARQRLKLPAEPMRDSMSRQELRQALKELEEELEESLAGLRAKNCLIREQSRRLEEQQQQILLLQTATGSPTDPSSAGGAKTEEQVKSLRRLLDQERLLSNNLKIDVGNLEQAKLELQTNLRMLERERIAMEEEVDKLRQVNRELNVNLEELTKDHRQASNRLKELQVNYEKARSELAQLRSISSGQQQATDSGAGDERQTLQRSPGGGASAGDLLLMTRDLSELKVKNNFLMRQLEIAREDTIRQLEDLRTANEAQQRRAVELAQIELKERHLTEAQQLRDEVNELKQKLATSQRQASRQEEETRGERERLRSLERDWKRDKSQAQQKLEQLEAQLAIERRSNEFKAKESESVVREKERALISMQDKYVQLERDLKRAQNKYNLLEENSESKQKSLARDLEAKKREVSELIAKSETREEEHYESCKRFNSEKAALVEAVESLRRSYDEKLAELKSAREMLMLRQEHAHKERSSTQERIDSLSSQLIKLSEKETQGKLLKQQLQMVERQLESTRRECAQLKEDKYRIKSRCYDLERRCAQYEKQELIVKTSNISQASAGSFLLRAKNPFTSSGGKIVKSDQVSNTRTTNKQQSSGNNNGQGEEDGQLNERLSGKINDQRHLINMLKQRLDEAQLEVKQLKLLQASERAKWQARVTLLQGQLNGCEERLLFETSLGSLTSATYESARQRLESKWAQERQSTLELVQQQQAQNELLARDLKKLTQSHDLLRLQSKQLEAHNNKLSRKLIEYQQEEPLKGVLRHPGRTNAPAVGQETGETGRKLAACLAERQELQARQVRLTRLNARLAGLLRDEARPLVETVSKMVAALEQQDQLGKRGEQEQQQQQEATDGQAPVSTQRPLMTTSRQQLGSDSGHSSDLTAASGQSSLPRAASPSAAQWRLSRLLSKPAKSNESAGTIGGAEAPPTSGKSSSGKQVRRVKVKSSALGITPSERRSLKRHLEELSGALDELEEEQEMSAVVQASQPPAWDQHQSESGGGRAPVGAGGAQAERASSEVNERRTSGELSRTARGGSCAPATGATVRWRLDDTSNCSDLDSEPALDVLAQHRRLTSRSAFTDCEDSESSLAASDYSWPAHLGARKTRPSGAESDSCARPSGSGTKVKRRGLKVRLTSTLRNISRSIGALATTSDSEADSAAAGGSSSTPAAGLREIRV